MRRTRIAELKVENNRRALCATAADHDEFFPIVFIEHRVAVKWVTREIAGHACAAIAFAARGVDLHTLQSQRIDDRLTGMYGKAFVRARQQSWTADPRHRRSRRG